MLKLTTDKHEAWRGLSATAELLVLTLLVLNIFFYFLPSVEYIFYIWLYVDLAITFVILDTLNIFLIDWLIDRPIWQSFCLGDFCRRLLHVTALTP